MQRCIMAHPFSHMELIAFILEPHSCPRTPEHELEKCLGIPPLFLPCRRACGISLELCKRIIILNIFPERWTICLIYFSLWTYVFLIARHIKTSFQWCFSFFPWYVLKCGFLDPAVTTTRIHPFCDPPKWERDFGSCAGTFRFWYVVSWASSPQTKRNINHNLGANRITWLTSSLKTPEIIF